MPFMGANSIAICEQLESWYAKPAGQYLLEQERLLVEELLHQVFGYHQLQLGITRNQPLGLENTLSHKIYAGASGGNIGLVTETDSLPFFNDSMDVVLLHHALEFADSPHRLLREAHRVLAPRGHLIVLGFNPLSLFGAGLQAQGQLPRSRWSGASLKSTRRLRDWLHLLGAEVEVVRHCFAVPPAGGERLFRYLRNCDQFLGRHRLPLGGVYAVHAQKQVSTLTPTRARWQRRMGDKLIDLTSPKPVPSPRGGDVAA
jgi:SAM-dependent methyltransferase